MKQLLCLICAWLLLATTIGCSAQQEESAEDSSSPSVEEFSVETDSTEPLESATLGPEQPASSTIAGGYGYTLKEIATIPNADHTIQANDSHGFFTETSNGKMLLTNLGEAKISQNFERIEHLGNGIFAVRTDYEDVNHAGVVTMGGDILIPFEAALIDWADSTYSDSERFLQVIYATGETTIQDECIVYSTDEIKLGIGDNDTMYAGYANVYDVVERRFVEGVTFSNKDSLMPCGNHFLITQDDGMTTLYDAIGNAVAHYEQDVRVTVGNGIFLIKKGSKYTIYDETANEVYSTEQNILDITHSSSGYFLETDKQYILTFVHGKQGEVVFSTEFKIISENDDIFTVRDNDHKYGLIWADGSEIVPCFSDSLTEIGCGYYRASNFETDQYALIGPHGVVAENITDYRFMQEKDGMVLVLNTGEFSLPADSMHELRDGLAYGSKGGLVWAI